MNSQQTLLQRLGGHFLSPGCGVTTVRIAGLHDQTCFLAIALKGGKASRYMKSLSTVARLLWGPSDLLCYVTHEKVTRDHLKGPVTGTAMRAACDLWQPAVYSTFTSSSTAMLCCALSPPCCHALLSACPTKRTVSAGISIAPANVQALDWRTATLLEACCCAASFSTEP